MASAYQSFAVAHLNAAARVSLSAAIAMLWLTAGHGQTRPVDLELVLAIDTSASVDAREYALQVDGLVAAFQNPEVVAAIEALGQAGIAVCVTQWSSAGQNRVALDWMPLRTRVDAEAFAQQLADMPRYYIDGGTALGAAIVFAGRLFDNNAWDGNRRVIDVSGDGKDNEAHGVRVARDGAAAAGITINGLAILNEDFVLDRYYRDYVIAGPAAFVVAAADYQAFAAAVRTKLIREIAGLPVAADDPPDHRARHADLGGLPRP